MINNSVDLIGMGERIKSLRKKQNKTQKFFADMLYISPSYLALIEQGKRTVTLDVLVQIANVCDVSTDYLLFGDDFAADDENIRIFKRLYQNISSEKLMNALHLAEYYLSLDNSSKTESDSLKQR